GRRYGQDLPTPGYEALVAAGGFPFGPTDPAVPADTPFFSDLSYRLKQYAAFGEGTWHATDQWAVTAGLRYYKFNEDKFLNFDGWFNLPPTHVPGTTDSNCISPRLIVSYKPVSDVELSAQAPRGFSTVVINVPINITIC